ncbi:MAG: acetate CoA/acetoacetate CoA-transferase beta subunit [Clostridia bacterium]|nr:acetate CoA/acetoacetate CoA-transferase beta subunit [Clostridia bacterium]
MSNDKRILIAKRVAQELKNGDVVNLGIGLPTLVANYLPPGVKVWLQSENGFIGMGPAPEPGQEDPDLVDAGGRPVTILPGGACFDSCLSFSIIRGGHLDATVLGALQVDEQGNLASWMIPGKLVPGMGGAMDLTVGARRVIIATEHNLKDGTPKIVQQCTLPLTAARQVDLIVTELAVIEVTPEGLLLKEIAADTTVPEVIQRTGARLIIPEKVTKMDLELAS